ncbi:Pyruvate kinase 2, cytosolic [Vitis vinifera]|uniref:pyruvate kinase n=1 Tax=Vitis vinifera TaxID=29760 RepID=A0A438DKL8_VITVI|nr:Pyruvate kinase 2, cytosolic [Vitis vinifera]
MCLDVIAKMYSKVYYMDFLNYLGLPVSIWVSWVFLFQKSAVHRCNMAGKPAIITRVVDSMTENLRPTRAEATDVANAVLDGWADGILLGPETLCGLYPIEAIQIVGKICAEAESVYNQSLHFKRIAKHVGEPMSHAESVASSAVRTAVNVNAAMIVAFTSTGGAPRPPVPVLAVVISSSQNKFIEMDPHWNTAGTPSSPAQVLGLHARQLLSVRGVHPILSSPNVATSGGSSEDWGLKFALNHCKSMGWLKHNDRVVVFQKIGDSSVAKIVELQD